MSDSGSTEFPLCDGVFGWWMCSLSKLPAVILWRKWTGDARCFCAESSGKSSGEECEGELVQLGPAPSWLWVCWVCKALKSDWSGWLKVGVSITFAFVLANKCAVFVWLVFSYPSGFFILTVIVYLDTIGCVTAKMLSVYLSEWSKRLFLLAGVTGSRCKK